MNEQIAKQARQYADENRPGSFEKYDPEWFSFYNKKFAELIIKECATEIRKQGNGASYDDWDRGYEAGLISAINALHKHFGVE